MDETEKRIGAVLLEGISLISLDNCTHDLSGELLCQLSERPVIRIRVLGQSAMPSCECHTMVFATGNNIGFRGDMIRRGLVCDLEALDERPELRKFDNDALEAASMSQFAPWLRFQSPLVKPGVRISRTRLLLVPSGLRSRQVIVTSRNAEAIGPITLPPRSPSFVRTLRRELQRCAAHCPDRPRSLSNTICVRDFAPTISDIRAPLQYGQSPL